LYCQLMRNPALILLCSCKHHVQGRRKVRAISVWEQRQEAQDRIGRNFSDYIRGVERFHDPLAGKEVELPAGYGRAWSNNLGEYIVSDSPGYNPNVGSNLHWQELTPAR
jgi:hypothetical protein